jgi:NAD(P)-dependent dehydrogenase (short-subunit alcohol dehydrogenase family)
VVIALAAATPDASMAALGRELRDLDRIALLAPEPPPSLDDRTAFVRADPSTAAGAETALAAVEQAHGPVSCLVMVPAEAPEATVEDLSDAVWGSTLAKNQTAAMHAARAAGGLMRGRGAGRIVLVGWRIDRPAGWAHLAATSGAIYQLARSLASEVGPYGVTVNAILVPPGALADAAGAVRLLASSDAGYMTGEVLTPGPSESSRTERRVGWGNGLAGRVVLVTGAGQGIGAEIAGRLAKEGAVVAVNSLHEDKAEATAERVRSAGGKAEAFPADVADPKQVDRMVTSIESRLGSVEVLVNNAAVLLMRELSELDLDDWHRQIAVNLTGPFLVSRRVIRAMNEVGWGRIVNVSSIWGLVGARGATAYAAAKGGLIELTRAMAQEVGANGVPVSGVAPGVVSTPQLAADAAFSGITVAEMERRYALDTVLGRIASASEIAGVVAFLASDEGAPFAGQTVPVTGGRSE